MILLLGEVENNCFLVRFKSGTGPFILASLSSHAEAGKYGLVVTVNSHGRLPRVQRLT